MRDGMERDTLENGKPAGEVHNTSNRSQHIIINQLTLTTTNLLPHHTLSILKIEPSRLHVSDPQRVFTYPKQMPSILSPQMPNVSHFFDSRLLNVQSLRNPSVHRVVTRPQAFFRQPAESQSRRQNFFFPSPKSRSNFFFFLRSHTYLQLVSPTFTNLHSTKPG